MSEQFTYLVVVPSAPQFSKKYKVDYSIALCRLDVLASSLVFINKYLLQSTMEFTLAASNVLFSIETSLYDILHVYICTHKMDG